MLSLLLGLLSLEFSALAGGHLLRRPMAGALVAIGVVEVMSGHLWARGETGGKDDGIDWGSAQSCERGQWLAPSGDEGCTAGGIVG